MVDHPGIHRLSAHPGRHGQLTLERELALLCDPAVTIEPEPAPSEETVALRAEVVRLRAERDALAELAYADPVTGLRNRRAFDHGLAREWATSARDGVDSFVLVADLDGFKVYNDRYGHAGGDAVLREFAAALQTAARATAVVARIGGDEFGIVLPGSGEADVRALAGSVRLVMGDARFPDLGELAVSVGYASLRESASPVAAMDMADRAMFVDKHGVVR